MPLTTCSPVRLLQPCLVRCTNYSVAMRDALTKGSRLHRDISVGNILLVKESGQSVRKGYLIDWESSCKVDLSGVACQGGRMVRLICSIRSQLLTGGDAREHGRSCQSTCSLPIPRRRPFRMTWNPYSMSFCTAPFSGYRTTCPRRTCM